MEDGSHSTRHLEHLKESSPCPRDVLSCSSPSKEPPQFQGSYPRADKGAWLCPRQFGLRHGPSIPGSSSPPSSEEDHASNLANWAECLLIVSLIRPFMHLVFIEHCVWEVGISQGTSKHVLLLCLMKELPSTPKLSKLLNKGEFPAWALLEQRLTET